MKSSVLLTVSTIAAVVLLVQRAASQFPFNPFIPRPQPGLGFGILPVFAIFLVFVLLVGTTTTTSRTGTTVTTGTTFTIGSASTATSAPAVPTIPPGVPPSSG